MFRIGQKVVCVDDDPNRDSLMVPRHLLIKNLDGLRRAEIYTIRAMAFERAHNGSQVLCVWLKEIVRPIEGADTEEPGYAVERFRPLVERKTDISIFKKLLAPKHTRELTE
jgi:hypothetical protein